MCRLFMDSIEDPFNCLTEIIEDGLPNITIDNSANTSQPITPKKTITPQIPNNSETIKPVKTTSKEQESVAKTRGIGESKEGAPPEQNPFESTDDLLQELE